MPTWLKILSAILAFPFGFFTCLILLNNGAPTFVAMGAPAIAGFWIYTHIRRRYEP